MSATAGVGSVLNGTNPTDSTSLTDGSNQPPTPEQNSVTGAIALGTTNALFNKRSSKSGAEMGAEQKAFNDAAYPDLNPWEAAGASSAAGAAQGEQENAAKMQKQQNKHEMAMAGIQGVIQSSIVDKQTEAQENVALIGAGESRHATDTQAATAAATLKQNAPLIRSQIDKNKYGNTAGGRAMLDLINYAEKGYGSKDDIKKAITEVLNSPLSGMLKSLFTDGDTKLPKAAGGVESAIFNGKPDKQSQSDETSEITDDYLYGLFDYAFGKDDDAKMDFLKK